MIRVNDLHKRHGAHEVLRGINLEVRRGDVTAIIGPSGSGKTTLLRCIIGLERFEAGCIDLFGRRIHADLDRRAHQEAWRSVRGRLGMVFQQFNLFAHLTAIENVIEAPMHVAGLSRDAAMARAETLLDRVGMLGKAERLPSRLSGGEQQRVAIARALAMEPEVILFDEPTSALDPSMADEVLTVMGELAASGQSMMVVTHSMDFARRAASRVFVFAAGRVVESGTPEEIFHTPKELVTRSLLQVAVG